ncbi:MAG: M24 family metallopeptidase, partial [Ktedonobacterales bacterium]
MSDHSERAAEIATKLADLRAMMAQRQIGLLRLETVPSCAWITAGARADIDESTDKAAFAIAITPGRAYVLTDTIETPRLRDEEHLDTLGFELVTEPWYRRGGFGASLAASASVGQDGLGPGLDLSRDVQLLRMRLSSGEVARMRRVCVDAGEAMAAAMRALRPGMTEFEAAALLAGEGRVRGGEPVVVLVGSDERIFKFRHATPTSKPIERYVMLALCLRRAGLVAALTRSVYFGVLPDDLRAKALATARVDVRMTHGSQPGKTVGDMFALARAAYATEGHVDALEEHHQGGTIGYRSREIIATP